MRKQLDKHGLVAEFVAPRLWEDPRTIDGAYTSNDPKCRRYGTRSLAPLHRHRRGTRHDARRGSGSHVRARTSARPRTAMVATDRLVEAF